jgi:mycofactocin precursor
MGDEATIAIIESEAAEAAETAEDLAEETLIEEISIDGMCGVY